MVQNEETKQDASAGASNEFETLFEESLRTVKPGGVVKGRVVGITSTHVLIDVGYKSEGQIPIQEFMDRQGNVQVKVGDDVDVSDSRRANTAALSCRGNVPRTSKSGTRSKTRTTRIAASKGKLLVREINHPHPGVERERAVRGGHLLHVVDLAVGGGAAVIRMAVPARLTGLDVIRANRRSGG